MDAWIVWLIVAALMVVLEIITQAVWTFCLAIGAFVALFLGLTDVTVTIQICVMAASSVIAYFVLFPYARRWYERSWKGCAREDRTGMEALLGRHAVVTHDIRPGELGRARIDGDYWQVCAPGTDRVIMRGEQVSVTAYDSIILTVQPINS